MRLFLTIHRGSREVGGTCIEIIHGNDRIVLDIGMPLVKPGGKPFEQREIERLSAEELVRKKFLPNIPGLYPHNQSRAVGGLFLSHAHMDHYGFYRYLHEDVHLYLGEGTRRLIEISALITGKEKEPRPYTTLHDGVPVSVGSIRVTPYLVDHSAFDAYAFLIEAGGKKIFYTGDFREHGRKEGILERVLQRLPNGIDVLLMEGTHVGNDGASTPKFEREIEQEMLKTVESAKGLVFIHLSSQNIDRIVSLYRTVLKTRRTLVLDVHTANVLFDISGLAKIPYPSRSYKNIRVYFSQRICNRYADMNEKDRLYRFKNYKISRDEIGAHPDRFVMVVKPSMLTEVSKLEGIEGAPLIYSMWGGYLREKSSEKLLHFIQAKGLRLVRHHTSGHAGPATLKKIVARIRPKLLIPIHTFHPEGFVEFSPNVMIAEDGIPITI